LVGDRLHPACGNGCGAGEQALQHDVEHPPAGRQRRIELDATNEGPEEAVDHGLAEAIVLQGFQRRQVLLTQERRGRGASKPDPLPQQSNLVGDRTNRCEAGLQEGARSPRRVAHKVHLRAVPHQRPRLEAPQVERVHIKLLPQFGVGG
jgi:hypothetical protein